MELLRPHKPPPLLCEPTGETEIDLSPQELKVGVKTGGHVNYVLLQDNRVNIR